MQSLCPRWAVVYVYRQDLVSAVNEGRDSNQCGVLLHHVKVLATDGV